MEDIIVIGGTISLENTVSGSIDLDICASGQFGMYIAIPPDTYTGLVSVTPSNETQTLPTAGLFLSEDITVDPIPQNYGLIEWNGTVLKIS